MLKVPVWDHSSPYSICCIYNTVIIAHIGLLGRKRGCMGNI